MRQMEAYARELRDAMERAPGIQHADIWGVPRSQVTVNANIDKLAALKTPISLLVDALQKEGADVPIGAVDAGGRRLNVKATGGFDSLEEIRNTVLRTSEGTELRVRDVADVDWSNDEDLHITRFNGHRALFITARAKLGATVFDVLKGLTTEVDKFEPRLPKDIKLERGFSQAETVSARLGSLGRDFGIAILLVLITLLPLGFRASVVVMMAVPLSFAIGVMAIQALGYSLNQLSIAGFVLALGLLVDDSIVVTENISRRLREGLSRRDAAIEGVGEINIAVIGCTATLLLAFLPLMSLPEGAGDFIRSLPAAVVATIAASLVVSLTVIPFLASRLLPRKAHSNVFLDAVMGGIHAVYRPILHVALGAPRITIAVALALSLGSLVVVPKLGFSLFPENDSPYFMVEVELGQGSSVADTDRAVAFADAALARRKEITWRFSNSGRGNPQIYYNLIASEQQSNVGGIYARVDHWEPKAGHKLLEGLQADLAKYPGARFNVRRFENGPPVEAPIAVRIRGADIDVLTSIAAEVEKILLATPGTRNVVNPMAERLIDLDLNIKTEAAALRGVPAGSLDQTMRIAIGGATVASYRDPVGDAYPVVVRAPRNQTFSIGDVSRLQVWTGDGSAVPLSEFATPRLQAGPARIDRRDRERTATITAFNAPGYLTGALTQEVNRRLSALTLPPGYTLSFGGQAEAQSRSFGGLLPAILIASFGIMAVLLLEFGSFATAAVVAFVIPMGIMGGLLALYIGKETLSFTAIIGFIALIGIEIKNSILLVEFANQLRAKGMALREAVELAGEMRFLPVLLTSLTAIGGLIPLVAEHSPLYSPLAMVIIGGLISSTLIARIVTPPLYLLLTKKEPVGADVALTGAPAE